MSRPAHGSTFVLMNDFRAEPEELVRREIEACERVIRSGWYILGKEVEQFEQAWAELCGCRYAVGVGNGMDAIEISLRSAGIGPDDEVITTAMTAFATALGIIRAGATPVLADIRTEDALLDITSVHRCLSPRTKAVLLVNLYGRVPDLASWKEFCVQHRLDLIEDCAQAHLAKWNGRAAGTFGRCGAFSFYPTKNLGAIGDGGAVITDSEELAAKAAILRNYGQIDRYHHPELGVNSRLDELQAALLHVRLGWVEPFTRRRRQIAAGYHARIRNPKIKLLDAPKFEENHVYHLFVIRCAERARLIEHLHQAGVQTIIHYPLAIHQQKPTRHLCSDPSGLPNSEKHAGECLSVPCHAQMTDAEVERVIDALNGF